MYKFVLDAVSKYFDWKEVEYVIDSMRDDGETLYINISYRPPMNQRNIEIKFSVDTKTGETQID